MFLIFDVTTNAAQNQCTLNTKWLLKPQYVSSNIFNYSDQIIQNSKYIRNCCTTAYQIMT